MNSQALVDLPGPSSPSSVAPSPPAQSTLTTDKKKLRAQPHLLSPSLWPAPISCLGRVAAPPLAAGLAREILG